MEVEERLLRQQPPPLSLSSSHFVLTLWPSRTPPSLSPSLSICSCIFRSHNLSFLSHTCGCCRARSPSFISPHEGNITGISLQEGCANTTTTPAHYRAVKHCLQPSRSVSHSFALSSATPARYLLPHMLAERRNINYPTVQLQSESIAEWAQGLLNSGQPSIRSC